MNIYIESYGCTRRKLDVSKFHTYFTLNGYEIVQNPNKADVILITTCAFKYDEEEQSMNAIEKFSKYDKRIIVYGCLPAIAPSKYNSKYNYVNISPKNINDIDKHFEGIKYKFSEIDDANLIDKKDNYSSLPTAIKKFTSDFELSVPFFTKSCRYVKNKYLTNQQMYYLFTSRGCLGNCSYCAVRFAVGPIKSKAIDIVTKEFSKGIDSGYKEFSVLGDDVGAYGQDRGSNLSELLAALQDEIGKRRATASQAEPRLNIEEINPRWIVKYEQGLTEQLAHKSVKSILCPLQSGNTRILGLMNRNDDIDRLLVILNEIHRRNPVIELNTQIIVGFPSETESEFEDSLTKLCKTPFNSVVLFPYDDKENTQAHEIGPKISKDIIQNRVSKAQVFLRRKGIKSALCCNE
jgi:tRNA A37 methylthiotransferase MiaB